MGEKGVPSTFFVVHFRMLHIQYKASKTCQPGLWVKEQSKQTIVVFEGVGQILGAMS